MSDATHHLVGPTLEEGVNSLLEEYLRENSTFTLTPEVLALVQVIYPGVEWTPSKELFLLDVDVYRIEITRVDEHDERLIRVGEKRAMAAVGAMLKVDGVSYVTVIREDRS